MFGVCTDKLGRQASATPSFSSETSRTMLPWERGRKQQEIDTPCPFFLCPQALSLEVLMVGSIAQWRTHGLVVSKSQCPHILACAHELLPDLFE